jgi:hypothetical protein
MNTVQRYDLISKFSLFIESLGGTSTPSVKLRRSGSHRVQDVQAQQEAALERKPYSTSPHPKKLELFVSRSSVQ